MWRTCWQHTQGCCRSVGSQSIIQFHLADTGYMLYNRAMHCGRGWSTCFSTLKVACRILASFETALWPSKGQVTFVQHLLCDWLCKMHQKPLGHVAWRPTVWPTLLSGCVHFVLGTQVYHALEAEQLIELERRVYCPYKDCSAMLEQPEQQGDQAADGQEAPFECPVCHRSFCVSCGIAGWHTVGFV
jgi:hypothetical protein